MKRWYVAFQVATLAISAGAFGAASATGSSTHGALGSLGATVAVALVALTLVALKYFSPASSTASSLIRRTLGIKDRANYAGASERGRIVICSLEGALLVGAVIAIAQGWDASPFLLGALFGSIMELLGLIEALPTAVESSRRETPTFRT